MSGGVSGAEAAGPFRLTLSPEGVAHILFDRPPVNAVSIEVYEALGRLVDRLEQDDVRVAILSAPDGARAWCGGADLRDFVGMDAAARKARYAFINAQLPRFHAVSKPVIAAMHAPVIGIGVILAGLCDMRIAGEDVLFSCPEIDYGLVAGGGAILGMARMPEAKVREMLFTGARFTARELEPTGFFNYVVPRAEVVPKALELANRIAGKSLPAIRARKQASAALDGEAWVEAYLHAQSLSGTLTRGTDGQEGVTAFLEKRTPLYRDG